MSEENEDVTIYNVVKNDEDQYSIWPQDRQNPLGWNNVGYSGPKEECLRHIDQVWTDMRPRSLREKMEKRARQAVSEK